MDIHIYNAYFQTSEQDGDYYTKFKRVFDTDVGQWKIKFPADNPQCK